MYTTLRHIEVYPDSPAVLADADTGRCRICGRREPAVTFRHPAHVFPKYMGITPCTSLNICDSCQQKYPFPKTAPSSKDPAKTSTTLTTPTTLLRIALTVVPESLLPHLRTTLRILSGDARPSEYVHFPVNVRRYPTSLPYLSAQILTLSPDNNDNINTPSLILLLSYSDTTLEMPIPGCDLDRHLLRTTYSLPILPSPHDTLGLPPLYSDLLHP